MNKGKCEVDSEKDCAWVLIYKELEKKNKLGKIKRFKGQRTLKNPANLII
jgi:hypothetical protein